jgi:hypothetical protein
LILCSLKSACKRADDRDQDASSDEAGNQIAHPTRECDTEKAEQPTSDSGPWKAKQSILVNGSWPRNAKNINTVADSALSVLVPF